MTRATWSALSPRCVRGEGSTLPQSPGEDRSWLFAKRQEDASAAQPLASSPAVAPAFVSPKVAGKAAHAVVHFLEVLLGPKCANLGVKDPKKYGFDPKQLVLAIVEFTVRLDGVAPGVLRRRWQARTTTTRG